MVYVLIGYDEDYYTFETFIGVFSTKEKAQECRDNDYGIINGKRYNNHSWYEIYEMIIDKPFSV